MVRLNVYAGLAGFYLLRDNRDTGLANNPITLPAGPYEAELLIADRQFDTNGQLFFPDGLPDNPAGLNGAAGQPRHAPLLDPGVLRRRHHRQRQELADSCRSSRAAIASGS